MAKGGPTRSIAPLPAGGGRPGKAVDQDDDAYDDGSRKKAANADSDLPIGDLESLTLGEYSRWVVTEHNWDVAEACREQHMEGEQMRKARDDRHRERGQIRQQDTVEQMKEAKTKVDAHRRANTEQGSNVKRDVIAWKEASNELKAEWAKFGASVRAAQLAVSSTEIRDALQASKKEKCQLVKQEETGLTAACERLRGEILAKNKDLVGRVKKETADAVTDESRAIFFSQRKAAAKATEETKTSWSTERKEKREQFMAKVQRLMEASRNVRIAASNSKKELLLRGMQVLITAPTPFPQVRIAASNSKKELLLQRRADAKMVKMEATQLEDMKQKNAESTAAAIKQAVNDRFAERFVPADSTRRMLQHPHYAEITAVAADVTSAISREIVANSKRLRRGAPAALKA